MMKRGIGSITPRVFWKGATLGAMEEPFFLLRRTMGLCGLRKSLSSSSRTSQCAFTSSMSGT